MCTVQSIFIYIQDRWTGQESFKTLDTMCTIYLYLYKVQMDWPRILQNLGYNVYNPSLLIYRIDGLAKNTSKPWIQCVQSIFIYIQDRWTGQESFKTLDTMCTIHLYLHIGQLDWPRIHQNLGCCVQSPSCPKPLVNKFFCLYFLLQIY